MHADGVRLGLFQLLRRDRLVAQLRELREQATTRHVLLLRPSRDVGHERAGERAFAGEGVYGIAQRLAVPQLIEEAPAQSARDAGDHRRREPCVVRP